MHLANKLLITRLCVESNESTPLAATFFAERDRSMFPIRRAKTFYPFALAGALALISGCGGSKLTSTLASHIVIDGEDLEWTDRQFYFKDERVTIGVAHDDQYFYLYLNTVDRALQMQVLRRGFTVLFDADGGNKTSFGVHYPLAMDSRTTWDLTDRHAPIESTENKERPQRSSNMGGRSPREGMDETNPAMVAAFFEKVVLNSELELIGKTAYDKRRLSIAAISEVEVALNYIDGRLVYELKVPLQRLQGEGYEVGIGARAGKDIGIGFSTPKIDRQAIAGQRRRRGGGARGGGFAGGGSGFGGAGGGRRGPHGGMQALQQALQQPLQLWTKVELSSD
jgi:uncharacterized membrane protein YgcG